MNQIISQHGWAFDSSIWLDLKEIYLKNNWIWQDSDRGYFNKNLCAPQWINNNSLNNKKVTIIHSLGTHLIDKNILINASHAIFINSFYNFITKNNDSKVVIRSLEKMKQKLNNKEIKPMLNKFYKNSFFPKKIDISLKKIVDHKCENLNLLLLENDFSRLNIESKPPTLVSKKCKVLIIKSMNDRILNNYSSSSFIKLMNNTQIEKPTIVELENQGHIISNHNIFKLIDNWLKR